ncbi:hypothetical protein CHRYSEOSP005_11760 [Chryseobacterium sp. Alg-005]
MKVSDEYYLGKDPAGFYIWNNKKVIRLISKDFKDACIELKLIIKPK